MVKHGDGVPAIGGGNIINFKNTKKVIDKWDPFKLIDFTTPNEYDREIKRIVDLANSNQDISTEILGQIIFDVFNFSFSGIFRQTESDCLEIAKQIIQL
ncbi:DUF1871 family protein [Clostridium sp. C8-1-8]|uniref:DUF1871 family protein n=1 Tax=Clostridium sp. C8-1-8 TaxID=2698831 RepID=UPI00136B6B74|nr:DUF1871 family protein [Clostridium sp. C8-1-8]